MNKIYVNCPGENWICDRMSSEFTENNEDICINNPHEADIIWLLAGWSWNQIPLQLLRNKKVICSEHHFVPDKFGSQQLAEFQYRDQFINLYHVPNIYTQKFLEQITKKHIQLIPYWIDEQKFTRTKTKEEAKRVLGLKDKFVISSFQRDTEGSDLISPKLEKGPDLLVQFLKEFQIKQPNLFVILGGWRRQYLIKELSKANIAFHYDENCSNEKQLIYLEATDLYPVASRFEGGPYSLLECSSLGIPMISRNIGMANQILSSEAINDNLTFAIPSLGNVEDLKIGNGRIFEKYRSMLSSI